MRARRVLHVAGVLLCASAPATASAAAGLDAELSPGAKWPERELVISLPDKRALSGDQVNLSENGQAVLGARLTSAASNRKRGVVLVIDTSLTMRGRPIREAVVAARAFAKRRPRTTPLGVVFFSDEPRIALSPTADARKIRTTLAVGPALSQGTRIYDAAGAGLSSLRRAGLTSGTVIVLSDGAEAVNGSSTTPTALAAAAKAANARVFSVGLESRSFDPAALQTMAAKTGGRYGQAARPQDLPPLFAAIGDRLSAEYYVSYKSTAAAGTTVRLEADVAGFVAPATVSYKAPEISFADVAPGRATAAGGLDQTQVTMLAVVAFLLVTFVLYLLLRPKRRSVVSRVADFAGLGHASPSMQDVRARDRRSERVPSDRLRRYTETIELSGIGLSPAAVAAWTAVATLGVGWYLAVVAGRPALIPLALAVPLLAQVIVGARVKARRRDFEDQLPDNLQMLASALRAGYSFTAAMAAMAEDAPEPSRTELRRASADEQLGIDVAESLEAVGTRMANQEIEYVGIVAQMQRESGGNTAEVLDQVITTVRERQRLSRMVRTLTAQSRLGGGVICAMPLVLGLGMSVVNPGYFDPMFESALGIALLLLAFLMQVAGWLAIRKIVDLET